MSYIETLFGHQDTITSLDALRGEFALSAGGQDRTVRYWKIVEESQLVFRGGGRSKLREVLEGGLDEAADAEEEAEGSKPKTRTVEGFIEGRIDCVAMLDESTFVSGGDSGCGVFYLNCRGVCTDCYLLDPYHCGQSQKRNLSFLGRRHMASRYTYLRRQTPKDPFTIHDGSPRWGHYLIQIYLLQVCGRLPLAFQFISLVADFRFRFLGWFHSSMEGGRRFGDVYQCLPIFHRSAHAFRSRHRQLHPTHSAAHGLLGLGPMDEFLPISIKFV